MGYKWYKYPVRWGRESESLPRSPERAVALVNWTSADNQYKQKGNRITALDEICVKKFNYSDVNIRVIGCTAAKNFAFCSAWPQNPIFQAEKTLFFPLTEGAQSLLRLGGLEPLVEWSIELKTGESKNYERSFILALVDKVRNNSNKSEPFWRTPQAMHV